MILSTIVIVFVLNIEQALFACRSLSTQEKRELSMTKLDKSISENVRAQLESTGYLWTYEGPPDVSRPHASLSGLHSDGYVNVGQFLKENPTMRENIATWMLLALREHWLGDFTAVVGAATSSTLLVEDVARLYGARHIKMIKTDDKKQIWDPTNQPLNDNDVILQVEDLLTTGGSGGAVRTGIIFPNQKRAFCFAPFLPVVVDRSNPGKRIRAIGPSAILPLLQLDIRNYDPNDCPYCKAGSVAIKPKEGNNWALLTGKA